MCGIAGVVGNANFDTRKSVDDMLNAMLHRGPDQEGAWQSSCRRATFGHRRLSILDLSELGRQPMVDELSGISLTYNGECYNFASVRDELKSAGYVFRSTSDTEVILKAYIEWGIECLQKLRGMFAMAIWDPRTSETFIVRDRLGIKPLYYTSASGCLLFASELRALLATQKVERKIDPQGLSAYLWHGFVPGPDTIVANVKRLDPGCYLKLDRDGNIQTYKRYWELPAREPGLSVQDAVAQSSAHLERAVQEHLASDVPLGVFLSGGVDSSVITALTQRTVSDRVVTYNIRFDESDFDESQHARKVASRLNTDHRELTLTESIFKNQLDDALQSLDQPTFDGLNTYFVSRAVREAGLTVALAGTGGDELFGGYPSFQELPRLRPFVQAMGYLPQRARNLIAKTLRNIVHRQQGEIRPQVRLGKLADLLETKGDLLGLYQVSYALFSREYQANLQTIGAAPRVWGLAEARADELSKNAAGDAHDLERVSRFELAGFLGERLLPDTDSASMASSLEVRVPLLDHVFVESLAQLTPDQRYAPLGRKSFLRSITKNELDPTLFDRPKAGFELPIESWSQQQLAPELDATFRDINLVRSIGLDSECLSRLWRASRDGAPGMYWSRLWSVFILINWCKRHGVSA